LRSGVEVRGLLFPASLAIRVHPAFVTNRALPLTDTDGEEPQEGVVRGSLASMNRESQCVTALGA